MKGITKLGSTTEYVYERPHSGMIECFTNPGENYAVTLETAEYSSLCPISGQPDFGVIIVQYTPDEKCIETKSLKLYLFAFRNERTFMESAVNKIRDDLAEACDPKWLTVTGSFSARGGIRAQVVATYRQKESWSE